MPKPFDASCCANRDAHATARTVTTRNTMLRVETGDDDAVLGGDEGASTVLETGSRRGDSIGGARRGWTTLPDNKDTFGLAATIMRPVCYLLATE
jgi:hypothetical protein